MKNKSFIIKIIVFLGIALCLVFCMNSGFLKNCDASKIKYYINSFGVLAPIVYIIMFTIVPLTLFPDSVLAVAGGMAFGMIYGTLYTIIGAVCGGILSFYIARYLGRGIVNKLMSKKGKLFEDGVEKRGFLIIVILRLIPLVPFDIISYGAGLSKIKFKDFILATAIGIVPGVLVFINLGDKALSIKSPEFVLSVIMLLALFIVSYILKKKISFTKLQKDIIKNEIVKKEDLIE